MMSKIYTAQDNLILYIYTGVDLSTVGSASIQGTDPVGISISGLSATIEDSDTGLLSYEVSNTDFTISGTYTLWVKLNYIGGATGWGEPFHLNVYSKGT